MDKKEILEAEIKRKIVFIQNYLIELRTAENKTAENIPKHLDTISDLQNENAKLKADREEVMVEHNEDLKKIDDLMIKLSKLVETDYA